MHRVAHRTPKPLLREDITSRLNLSALGPVLQPVIEETLEKAGKAKYRKGTILTPLLTVYVVLALAIRRDLSYPAAMDWLISGLRWITCCLPKKLVADGALSHARKRLGIDVFRQIFERLCPSADALPKDFHGRTSAAFDGSSITMPDTASNQDRFGRPKGGRGKGGFPQLRLMALLILPLRTVADIAYGPFEGKGSGERSLMMEIMDRISASCLLFLVDAGLYSFDFLQFAQQHGHDVLAKLSASVKPKPIRGKRFADGSYLAVIRKKIEDPERSTAKRKAWITIEIVVRIIDYQIPGFRSARLITTILDTEITAKELAIHYHLRWDIEIAFDEIKTHQCATLRGQAPTILRSKTAELVEQELYAVLIVYNCVRDLITQAAGEHQHDPTRISFLDSLQCIVEAIPQISASNIERAQTQFSYLINLIAECEIDRPRRPRVNPRVIKVKMSKFERKKDSHKSSYRDLENDLQILQLQAA